MTSLTNVVNNEEEQEQLKLETARLRNALNFSSEVNAGENDENDQFLDPLMEPEPELSAELLSMDDLRRCLDLNLDYQATVRSYLDKIKKTKTKIEEEIEERRKEIEVEKSKRLPDRFVPIAQRTGPITLFCFKKPYFKQTFGLYPPPNQDIRLKTLKCECLAAEEYYESGWLWWKSDQQEKLYREVRRECLARLLEPHIKYRDELRILAAELCGSAATNAEKDLQEAEQTIKDVVRENDNDNLYANDSLIEQVDWMKVAKRIGGIANYITCRLVWCNYCSPLINKKAFTLEEDEKLKAAVVEFVGRDWLSVATTLGTARTAFQCLQRYESKLTAQAESQKHEPYRNLIWLPDEDKKLLEVVAAFNLSPCEQVSATKFINWRFVSQNVGQHSHRDCCERYVRLTAKLNLGIWSDEEDRRHEEAIEIYGTDWVSVSTYVVTRSPQQCYDHWHNYVVPKKVKAQLETESSPEWTEEEDTVIWFGRHSKSRFLRNYTELARFLPRRHRVELACRFRRLKSWFRQAQWLVKTEGSLMSLLVKSDSELSLAEVDKLRVELKRLQTQRRKKAKTPDEVDLANNITFAEESQLERLINAMVVEASLSRDLVREKLKLMQDIVELKAVPVPLMQRMGSTNPQFFTNRLTVMSKIKELLLKTTAQRQQKQFETDLVSLADMDVDSYQDLYEESGASSSVKTTKTTQNFSGILGRIQNALRDPVTATKARQTISQLNSIHGGTAVSKLLKMTRQLESLARRANPRNADRADRIATPVEFSEYRKVIGQFLKEDIIYRLAPRRQFYEHLSTSPHLRQGTRIVIDYSAMNETTKLLVLALGTNLEGVIAELMQKRDSDEASNSFSRDTDGAQERENINKIAAGLGVNLDAPLADTVFRRYYSSIAYRALTAPIDDAITARGIWKTIRQEFDDTVNATPEEFADNDLSPVFPPCQASTTAYRLLTMSRLRLRDLINTGCKNAVERDRLSQKLQNLKERPPEGYALLQRRFDALFSWPALLDKVMPETYNSRCHFGKDAPPKTPADLMAIAEVPTSDEELKKDWFEDAIPPRTKKLMSLSVNRNTKFRKVNVSRADSIETSPPKRVSDSTSTVAPKSVASSSKRIKTNSASSNGDSASKEPPHRSERIAVMIKEGRYPESVENPSNLAVLSRKRHEQKAYEKMRQEALTSPTRKTNADFQLKMMVPFVPVVPLEHFPFPQSRVPNVPKVVKSTKPPVSNRAFALAVAARIIEKYNAETECRKKTDLSVEPMTPLKLPSAKLTNTTSSAPRQKTGLKKGCKRSCGPSSAVSSKKRSRTGLKRGYTRSGPSPDPEVEESNVSQQQKPQPPAPKRAKIVEETPLPSGDMDVDGLQGDRPLSPLSSHSQKSRVNKKRQTETPAASGQEVRPPTAVMESVKQKYYYRLKSPVQSQTAMLSPTAKSKDSVENKTPAPNKLSKSANDGNKLPPSSVSTPLVQQVGQSVSTPVTAQFPTSVISSATPGQAVALIQLNHEDVMRLFQSGARSVAIAIALPPTPNTNSLDTQAPEK